MEIEVGKIVKNLIPSESVIINKIQNMGDMISLTYTGVNTSKKSSKGVQYLLELKEWKAKAHPA